MDLKTYIAVGELVQAAAHAHGITGPVEFTVCRPHVSVPGTPVNDPSSTHEPNIGDHKPMYFTLINDNLTKPSNNLRKQVRLLEAESNRLVDDPNGYLTDLIGRIKDLERANPRCNPLCVDRRNGLRPGSINVYVGSWFAPTFSLFPVKDEPPMGGII